MPRSLSPRIFAPGHTMHRNRQQPGLRQHQHGSANNTKSEAKQNPKQTRTKARRVHGQTRRHTDTHRHTETHRDTHTHTDTDTHTDRHTQIHTDTERVHHKSTHKGWVYIRAQNEARRSKRIKATGQPRQCADIGGCFTSRQTAPVQPTYSHPHARTHAITLSQTRASTARQARCVCVCVCVFWFGCS